MGGHQHASRKAFLLSDIIIVVLTNIHPGLASSQAAPVFDSGKRIMLGGRKARSAAHEQRICLEANAAGRLWPQQSPTPDREGRLLCASSGHGNPILQLAFNGDGKVLASGDRKGGVVLYFLGHNRFATVVRPAPDGLPISCLAFTKRRLEEVLVVVRTVIRVFAVDGRRETAQLRSTGHQRPISAVRAAGCSAFCLSLSSDACILWDVGTWTRLRSLFSSASPFADAAFVAASNFPTSAQSEHQGGDTDERSTST
ncbi:unnamed protein product, partial [Amoebophrya sp. A25]